MNEDLNLSFQKILDHSQKSILDIPVFISKLIGYEKQIDYLIEENKFVLYLNLGKVYCFDGSSQDLPLAEKYLKMAELNFSEQIIKKYELELLFNLGHLYARKKCYEKSKEYFEKYILDTNDFVTLNIETQPLYSFRKINKYTISDLVNNEITLSDPKVFNDPYDTILPIFLKCRNKVIINKSDYSIEPYMKAYEPMRIRCFASDKKENNQTVFAIKDRLMWSHYADEHKGICIKYQFKFNPYSIQKIYANLKSITNWLKINYIEEITFGDIAKASKQLLLATKQSDWGYENEFRLFHYDPLIKEEQSHVQIRLEDLGGQIKAIILGSRCSIKDEQTIRALFKDQDIFFKIRGIEHLGINDNVYDLKIDNEKKWNKLFPK